MSSEGAAMMMSTWRDSASKLCLAIAAMTFVTTLTAVSASASNSGGRQETFSTPEKAVDALVQANRTADMAALLKILGPDSRELIDSGDPVADAAGRNRFVAAYDASHKLESQGADKMLVIVGKENWPLPIPLVRQNGAWRFDTKAGQREILDRRIGRNELKVIEVCRAYVEAQREYAAKHSLGNGRHEYARRFVSTSGKHDGLYWPTTNDESPLGPLIAAARAAGYFDKTAHDGSRPYYGYYYKILTRQGPHAPGGAKDYVVNGHMTGGFGLVAFPAKYGNSGVMTFIVNQDGIVYQKDLGPDTTTIAGNMTQFDPDQTWSTP